MEQKQLVMDTLNKMNIEFEDVEHEAAWTTEEADKAIEGKEGVRSKTLFMAGKKDRRFYLVIMDDNKRLDLKKIGEIVGDRLHFSSENQLQEKLNLVPGMVSLFGLINNKEHDVEIYIDKELLNESIITFHPNINTSTFFIKMDDMFKFIKELGYEYNLVEL